MDDCSVFEGLILVWRSLCEGSHLATMQSLQSNEDVRAEVRKSEAAHFEQQHIVMLLSCNKTPCPRAQI